MAITAPAEYIREPSKVEVCAFTVGAFIEVVHAIANFSLPGAVCLGSFISSMVMRARVLESGKTLSNVPRLS